MELQANKRNHKMKMLNVKFDEAKYMLQQYLSIGWKVIDEEYGRVIIELKRENHKFSNTNKRNNFANVLYWFLLNTFKYDYFTIADIRKQASTLEREYQQSLPLDSCNGWQFKDYNRINKYVDMIIRNGKVEKQSERINNRIRNKYKLI